MNRLDGAKSAVESQRVLAIVLNWNLSGLTRQCVESLQSSDYEALDIVVADNGSTDGSAIRLRNELPTVQVLQLRKNRGFAGGNNTAIRQADNGQEWFLLINNDASVASDTVSELLRIGRRTQGIVTPLIYEFPTGHLWHGGAVERRLFPVARKLSPTELAKADMIPIDYATGCVLLIHRTVFEKIGLLDERFFMYYEDLDFSLRARRAGVQLVAATKAVSWHAVGASLQSQPPTRVFLQFRSRTLWCRMNHGWHAASWWSALLFAIVRSTANSMVRRDWKTLSAIWRGVLAGLHSSALQTPRIAHLSCRKSGQQADDTTLRRRQ